MNTVGPRLQRAPECEAILRTLPMWFGIEHALQMYVEDTARLPTFALEDDGRLLAFLSLREHFPVAWEVHCVAVAASARGKGLGSRLLAHAEAWLVERGVEYLQVKTVAATAPSAEYAQTRKFYAARGFTPLEIFPELWNARNPALQLVKRLGGGSSAAQGD
jgi:GNAT superfamily N-acetyltransferase